MLFLFFLRFFVFHLYESPKFLVGRGKDSQAIEVLQKVAKYNSSEFSLSLSQLTDLEIKKGDKGEKDEAPAQVDTSVRAALRRNLEKFELNHIKALFATRQLAYSTSLVILLWGMYHSPSISRFFLI